MNGRDSLLAALVATGWGFNFVVIDWGMHDVPPLLFAAIRFTLVVLPAIFFVPRPPAPWRTVAAVGVFMSLGQFGLLYVAMDAGLPPGLAALVLQAQVIFTIALAAVVLRERPTRPQVVGVLVASGGLVVVALGRGGHVTVAALTLCLLGALSWGIGNVVSRASGVSGGLSLTVWSATVVPIPLFLLSLALDGPTAVADALVGFTWRRSSRRCTPPGSPRWWATASSTRCSAATRRRRWCPGCCWPRWWRWPPPGSSSTRSPRRPSCSAGACSSSACSSPCGPPPVRLARDPPPTRPRIP